MARDFESSDGAYRYDYLKAKKRKRAKKAR